MPFDVKAVRKAVPLLISVASVSGGGKTYSSLLLAAGIAGPNGKIGMIDTEHERGSMYADSPGILKNVPQGYFRESLDPPFSPRRYLEKILQAEQNGVNVLIIDSASHEWEGTGGCEEIAATNKLGSNDNWGLAKLEHKRFMNPCLAANMHIIFCLRAREKVKYVKNEKGKLEIIPIGLQPICEKNLPFEMVVSLILDEQTHFAKPIKVPEPLLTLFPGEHLLTREDGERIRQWNESGRPLEVGDQLKKRAHVAAQEGVEAYRAFFQALTKEQRKAIQSLHEEFKYEAEQADLARQKQAEQEKEMSNV